MTRAKYDEYGEGRGVLETLLEGYGEEEFLRFIKYRVSDGKTLIEVGEELRVPFPVLWEWMSDELNRLEIYQEALKGLSDQIVHGMIQVAKDSGDAKVRLDAVKWLSSRWDRGRFGENVKVEVSHSVSLIGLLSSLKELPNKELNEEVGELIEGEVVPELVKKEDL